MKCSKDCDCKESNNKLTELTTEQVMEILRKTVKEHPENIQVHGLAAIQNLMSIVKEQHNALWIEKIRGSREALAELEHQQWEKWSKDLFGIFESIYHNLEVISQEALT